jgi:PAS domain S-box-containing protein
MPMTVLAAIGGDLFVIRQLRQIIMKLGIWSDDGPSSTSIHLQRHDELAREARRFRALVETGSDGVVLLDRDVRFLYASPSMTRLLGYPLDEIIGHPGLDFVHPEDRVAIAEQLAELVRTPRGFIAATFRALAESGMCRWIEAEASNLLDDPDVGAIVGKYRDISDARGTRGALQNEVADRKRAEQALEKLSHAIEQTADSVMVTDRNGVIEYVNPAFEVMTGYTRAEAVGHTPRLLNSGLQTPRFYETLWTTILRGEVFRVIVTNRTKDGRLYDEDQTITPVRNHSGVITHFVSTGRDITQRRRTQEALRRLNQQLENEAARIAGVLHDEAGQFLTSAHLLLADIATELEPSVRDRLKDVRRTLDQVEEQLRRVSHEIHPRVVEDLGLNDAIRFVAGAFTRRTGIPITVHAELNGRYPRTIETVLYRLVQEGLTNMSRHARPTAGCIALSVEREVIRCSVRDDGRGFDAAAIMGSRGGCGLGLRLIQDRLEAVGGTLVVISAPDQGTELRAAVPLEV